MTLKRVTLGEISFSLYTIYIFVLKEVKKKKKKLYPSNIIYTYSRYRINLKM